MGVCRGQGELEVRGEPGEVETQSLKLEQGSEEVDPTGTPTTGVPTPIQGSWPLPCGSVPRCWLAGGGPVPNTSPGSLSQAERIPGKGLANSGAPQGPSRQAGSQPAQHQG